VAWNFPNSRSIRHITANKHHVVMNSMSSRLGGCEVVHCSDLMLELLMKPSSTKSLGLVLELLIGVVVQYFGLFLSLITSRAIGLFEALRVSWIPP
jgi:hypothetical protein